MGVQLVCVCVCRGCVSLHVTAAGCVSVMQGCFRKIRALGESHKLSLLAFIGFCIPKSAGLPSSTLQAGRPTGLPRFSSFQPPRV